jgi:Photosynthesis system II assembly factor YCF48/Putative zinc-finger
VSEFSNLLRQRLPSRTATWVRGELHPDADTLTAYAERALAGAERNRVLEHLASCSQCRDVLALSLAEPVEALAAPGPATTQSIPWWRQRWAPRIGLAASLATLAVIAAVVVELPRKQPAFEDHAKKETRPVAPENSTTPAPESVQPGVVAQPPASREEVDRLSATGAGFGAPARAQRRETDSAGNRVPVIGKATTDAKDASTIATASAPVDLRYGSVAAFEFSNEAGSRQDYLNNQIFSDANGAAPADLPTAPAAKPASPFQLQNALSGNTQFGFSNLPAPNQQNTKVLTIHNQRSRSRLPMTVLGQIPLMFRGATPAIRPNVTSSFAMGGPEFNPLKEKGETAEVAAAAPPLERSDLDRSAAFSPRALSDKYEKTSGASWKVDGGKLWKYGDAGARTQGYPDSEGIDFSVVKSHGSDIWAGGSNAALLHSRDGGATWERITLGASATGAITAIEIRGLNVQVKSSSGQSWSSQDGGKSWTLAD